MLRRLHGKSVQIYQGSRLPDFYFRRGHLLIGDYREWSKHYPDS